MSMKYDCNKTLDCIHELLRICDYYNECYDRCAECPLRDSNCEWPELTQTDIDILQKWSDEHLEQSKLTKADKTLMDMCYYNDGRAWSIERSYYGLYVACVGTGKIPIEPHMFKMVGVGDKKTFDDLLKLEVEDER